MSLGSKAPFNNTGKAEICLLSGQQSGIIIPGAKSGWMESLNRFIYAISKNSWFESKAGSEHMQT